MGTLLQYTDVFNEIILRKMKGLASQSRQVTQTMLENQDIEVAKAIVKCMQAQPYFVELFDTVPLFEQEVNEAASGTEDGLLVSHLRQLVYPEYERL